jgi:hypothetical protein
MKLGGPLSRPGNFRVQKQHLLLPEIKPNFLGRLARSYDTIPTELPHLHTRMFPTICSGDIALHILLTHYSIFLSMNVSDLEGAELACGG